MAKISKSIEVSSVELLELMCKEYNIKKEGSVMSLVLNKGKFEGMKVSFDEIDSIVVEGIQPDSISVFSGKVWRRE
ncbi:hypothetical protein [Myroides odoratimimus]|uniref:hypothetical protein n=1 Tax=Myroides odoratimimus TaxID=76832 RepID=UPI00257835D3|nr:hypothetical protein [Myroides odoratimimus]MDM1325900.1 hypothetical protein [Myroides odoratimimus]MDM1452195.1 hypothetical protein [Myroides odoratimimus]MDM1475466.1 hypothetical protein [Myroides odoratimimus]MDM1488247.1 hypothetical protein [Myroides odoratimimus]